MGSVNMTYRRPIVRGVVTIRLDDGTTYRGENLVLTTGLQKIVQALIGAATFGATDWYVELGTGTTSVTSADTALATPATATWRVVTSAAGSSATVTLETVYPAASANGTWAELGLWSGGTATPGSGTMFARLLTAWTKTSAQVATVSWTVTFSTT